MCGGPFSRAAAEGSSPDLHQGERLARATALIEAAVLCDRQDAEMVMSSLLEEFRAGPPLPALVDVENMRPSGRRWRHLKKCAPISSLADKSWFVRASVLAVEASLPAEAMRAMIDASCSCEPDDARTIRGPALDELRAGAPAVGWETDIDAEAENWAVLSTPDELRAYFFAIGRVLREQ